MLLPKFMLFGFLLKKSKMLWVYSLFLARPGIWPNFHQNYFLDRIE